MALLYGYAAATLLTLALMVGTWVVQKRIRNAGIVDVLWSWSVALPAYALAVVGTGASWRRAALVAAISAWALRLCLQLAKRFDVKHEDGRYAALRQEWGAQADLRMLRFYLFQGLGALVVTPPLAIIAFTPGLQPHVLEYIGMALIAVGLIGETTADTQLARFKANPAMRGGVCRVGLWRYSRHPNYFFEWTVWLGFGLWAIPGPFGWAGLVAPALMYHFLMNVTGVRITDEHMLRTRGAAFREYMDTTSSFFPWFPRKPRA